MRAPEPVVELATRWLLRARADLVAARTLEAGAVDAWIVGFHAQQAIEKAIKAALVFEQIEFPRTHDLERLAGLVPSGWELDLPSDRLARISEFGAETRYPPEGWNEVPSPTAAEVRDAVSAAEAAVAWLGRELARRGVPEPSD